MALHYEEHRRRFIVLNKRSENVSMHIHKHFEMILVTAGTLELGIGQEWFHMEKGDFAIVFPELIHQYRVPEKGKRRSIYILADLNPDGETPGSEDPLFQHQCPQDPVISAQQVHPDILYAVKQLSRENDTDCSDEVRRAFVQLILARAVPEYHMIDKSQIGCSQLVYRTVEYIAEHYDENLSLAEAAHALGESRYTLSRVFSGMHTNFNQYLNMIRIDHAVNRLLYTDESITDICYRCGFESQRTFNRAFKAYLGMTPREYRNTRLAPGTEES